MVAKDATANNKIEMSEGTRKGIELAIYGILRERMAAEGYGYTKDSGDNHFTKSGGGAAGRSASICGAPDLITSWTRRG